MSWRFRRSFKVIPGLRLNLSKSGLSASIGGAPFTLNVGPRGLMGTSSIPGTGISFRHHFSSQPNEPAKTAPSSTLPSPVPVLPEPQLLPSSSATAQRTAPIEEIHSASTELLTSDSLKEVKRLMQMTYEEREDISNQLDSARPTELRARTRYESWENGFLFKRLFKGAFAKRKAEAETESARVAELEEQLRLTKVATQIEIAKEQADSYFQMRDAFAAVSECAAIWDIKTRQATDRFRERTIATQRIERERVAFSLGSCDLLEWEQKVPHLQNANGGDLFLYPGFILYRAARTAFSLIDYHDVNGNLDLCRFHEEEGVPKDSNTVGQTWAKANKDGSPDRRFANNYPIPIVAYAHLTLKSNSGLWEEYHFSNVERTTRFTQALIAFEKSFAPLPVEPTERPN